MKHLYESRVNLNISLHDVLDACLVSFNVSLWTFDNDSVDIGSSFTFTFLVLDIEFSHKNRFAALYCFSATFGSISDSFDELSDWLSLSWLKFTLGL